LPPARRGGYGLRLIAALVRFAPLPRPLVAALTNIDPPRDDNNAPANPPGNSWIVLLGLLIPIAAGVFIFFVFAPQAPPPPAEVQNDPLLMEGRAVFLARCVTCHGFDGRGDGPTAAGFTERVGDLSDGRWEYGDQPEDVIRVIHQGIPDTRMAPWGQVLEESEIKAVAAYCYYLSRLPVPEAFRSDEPLEIER